MVFLLFWVVFSCLVSASFNVVCRLLRVCQPWSLCLLCVASHLSNSSIWGGYCHSCCGSLFWLGSSCVAGCSLGFCSCVVWFAWFLSFLSFVLSVPMSMGCRLGSICIFWVRSFYLLTCCHKFWARYVPGHAWYKRHICICPGCVLHTRLYGVLVRMFHMDSVRSQSAAMCLVLYRWHLREHLGSLFISAELYIGIRQYDICVMV